MALPPGTDPGRPCSCGELPAPVVVDSDFPEVSTGLLEPSRWRLLWAAPLKLDVAIHTKDMHGLVSYIRHHARSLDHHGRICA
eukprot:10358162-Lingulodinium_polyedra.AAC.1